MASRTGPVATGKDLDNVRLANALVELGASIDEAEVGVTNVEINQSAPANDKVTTALTVEYCSSAENELLMNPVQYGGGSGGGTDGE